MPWQFLADTVLLLHFGIVLFVLLDLPAIVIGNLAGWRWANGFGWRLAHLLAIAVIAVQAWLGRYCPLTLLESWLREQAGQQPYPGSFIGHWMQRMLYFEAPLWVFAMAYTAFAALVVLAWWRYRPHRPLRSPLH